MSDSKGTEYKIKRELGPFDQAFGQKGPTGASPSTRKNTEESTFCRLGLPILKEYPKENMDFEREIIKYGYSGRNSLRADIIKVGKITNKDKQVGSRSCLDATHQLRTSAASPPRQNSGRNKKIKR